MKSSKTSIAANIIAVVGVLSVLLFGGFLAISNTDLERRLEAANDNSQKLYQQLLAAGIPPAAPATSTATSIVGDTGPRGFPGKDGVDGLNGALGGTGNAGSNGKDGVGIQGLTGIPGTSITGPEGIAGAAGAVGSPGKDGTTGVAGRGVVSISCVRETNLTTAFRFVFTDLTTQDIPAVCIAI